MKKGSKLPKERIPSSTVGAAGEHYVLSQLLRNNFIAGRAPDNTKDFDLVVLNANGTQCFPIQVKTVTDATDWVLKKKHEIEINDLFYIFVRFFSEKTQADCYVIDSKTVAKVCRMENECWLKLPAKRGQSRTDSDMRKLSADLSKLISGIEEPAAYLSKSEIRFLTQHSSGWLDKYRDAWDLLR